MAKCAFPIAVSGLLSSFMYQESSTGAVAANPALEVPHIRLEQISSDVPQHYLAQKDLSLYPLLAANENAGVSSFKIEGRLMRSKEQLARFIASYRRALDSLRDEPETFQTDMQEMQTWRKIAFVIFAVAAFSRLLIKMTSVWMGKENCLELPQPGN